MCPPRCGDGGGGGIVLGFPVIAGHSISACVNLACKASILFALAMVVAFSAPCSSSSLTFLPTSFWSMLTSDLPSARRFARSSSSSNSATFSPVRRTMPSWAVWYAAVSFWMSLDGGRGLADKGTAWSSAPSLAKHSSKTVPIRRPPTERPHPGMPFLLEHSSLD